MPIRTEIERIKEQIAKLEEELRILETCEEEKTCDSYADVAPVRHGRWKPGDMPTWYKCSVCGGNTVLYKATYCPHCGARMDGTEPQTEDEHGR